MNGIKAPTIYQLAPEPLNQHSIGFGTCVKMAPVATSFDGPASSWFKSVSETVTQDWCLFRTMFLEQLNGAIIKFTAEAEAQNIQLATTESFSFYACRVEKLVIRG